MVSLYSANTGPISWHEVQKGIVLVASSTVLKVPQKTTPPIAPTTSRASSEYFELGCLRTAHRRRSAPNIAPPSLFAAVRPFSGLIGGALHRLIGRASSGHRDRIHSARFLISAASVDFTAGCSSSTPPTLTFGLVVICAVTFCSPSGLPLYLADTSLNDGPSLALSTAWHFRQSLLRASACALASSAPQAGAAAASAKASGTNTVCGRTDLLMKGLVNRLQRAHLRQGAAGCTGGVGAPPLGFTPSSHGDRKARRMQCKGRANHCSPACNCAQGRMLTRSVEQRHWTKVPCARGAEAHRPASHARRAPTSARCRTARDSSRSRPTARSACRRTRSGRPGGRSLRRAASPPPPGWRRHGTPSG